MPDPDGPVIWTQRMALLEGGLHWLEVKALAGLPDVFSNGREQIRQQVWGTLPWALSHLEVQRRIDLASRRQRNIGDTTSGRWSSPRYWAALIVFVYQLKSPSDVNLLKISLDKRRGFGYRKVG